MYDTGSVVGGGRGNLASGVYSTVSGGFDNTGVGQWAVIGGGYNNSAMGDYATVPGGSANRVAGDFGFAAGHGDITRKRKLWEKQKAGNVKRWLVSLERKSP